MSLKSEVAKHLPYLRRHARALTGSQASGDAYVRATLEAIIEGEAELEGSLSPRAALYRVFHAIWEGGARRIDRSSATSMADGRTPEERLQSLGPMNRQALL